METLHDQHLDTSRDTPKRNHSGMEGLPRAPKAQEQANPASALLAQLGAGSWLGPRPAILLLEALSTGCRGLDNCHGFIGGSRCRISPQYHIPQVHLKIMLVSIRDGPFWRPGFVSADHVWRSNSRSIHLCQVFPVPRESAIEIPPLLPTKNHAAFGAAE